MSYATLVDLIKKNFLSGFVLIFLFFITFFFLIGCSSQKTIVNGLDEKEANEIIVFLATKGIDAMKVPAKEAGAGGGAAIKLYDVSVDASSAIEAMSILNMNGLPRRRGQNLLNLFQSGGLVPSEMEERIRYEAGLAEQIASTIRKIDGVLDTDVQLSFPAEDPLNPGKKIGRVTASVYIKHQGVLDDPNSHLITKIKRLVASSVNDLDFDNVTVISDRARFTDLSLPSLQGGLSEDEKEYVRVWSIIIAKDSLSRFRILFFTLSILILALILAFIWVGWKVFPVLSEHGGIKELFTLKPLSPVKTKPTDTTDNSKKNEKSGETKKGEEIKPESKPESKVEGDKEEPGPSDESPEAS